MSLASPGGMAYCCCRHVSAWQVTDGLLQYTAICRSKTCIPWHCRRIRMTRTVGIRPNADCSLDTVFAVSGHTRAAQQTQDRHCALSSSLCMTLTTSPRCISNASVHMPLSCWIVVRSGSCSTQAGHSVNGQMCRAHAAQCCKASLGTIEKAKEVCHAIRS